MVINTPFPGLDNYMTVETPSGTKRVMYERSSKFEHITKPGASVKGVSEALSLDFVVRAKSPESALDLMEQVWGE